jgi:hypothetical protein
MSVSGTLQRRDQTVQLSLRGARRRSELPQFASRLNVLAGELQQLLIGLLLDFLNAREHLHACHQQLPYGRDFAVVLRHSGFN